MLVNDEPGLREHTGFRIDVDRVSRLARVRGSGQVSLLENVSLTVSPGELVAIVGASGAGKTTLLEAIAGIAPATSGSVRFDGVDARTLRGTHRGVIGYVPQDDIVHRELSVQRTVRYAARLRLPSSTTDQEIDGAVASVLDTVGLSHAADTKVDLLSGGQRKRASIAVELVTAPRVFLLDEPTSGLDPSTSADLLAHLRMLADRSATVIFTTHAIDDLAHCDRIVFMANGGRVAFVGTIAEAFEHFGVTSMPALYARLAEGAATEQRPAIPAAVEDRMTEQPASRPVAGAYKQWRVLTQRTLETMVRNRLTLAIMVASPILVVGMFVILFRPGAFDFSSPSPSSMVMIGFWIVFAAFFFGITYGLLQICTERPIVRREHFVGVRLGAYVGSKVTVLVPFLVAVIAGMLVVLRVLDRLPDRPLSTYASLAVTLVLCAIAALALGLFASAAVGNVAQATLALPMLCFPAVLFSGAILPVHLMAGAGAALSTIVPSRWAFEAVGHDLGARRILEHGGSSLGPPLLASFGNAGSAATGTYWAILLSFSVVLLIATWRVLARTTATR
jgi:ABC-type multidrug transport system ATPase subunit